MTEPIVSVRGLSKVFEIRKRRRIGGLDATVLSSLLSLAQQIRPRRGARTAKVRHLLALDRIDLDVRPGEVLGIIGRNGAGKSTLLKILARVIAPSAGTVRIHGRIASILELGLGFSPELTVVENIRLYGRLSGMRSDRIEATLSAILEFSGLAAHGDVRLEACPSGSFVRLAFATMMATDADLILADEILAVGDASFRSQCEERVRRFASEGGAVLFVSHDMGAIARICTRVAWIDRGGVRAVGEPEAVIGDYRRSILDVPLSGEAAGARILDVSLASSDGATIGAMQLDTTARITCLFAAAPPVSEVTVVCDLVKGTQLVCRAASPPIRVADHAGPLAASLVLPAHLLNESRYTARLHLACRSGAAGGVTGSAVSSLEFQVLNTDNERSVWAEWDWGRPGLISPRLDWTASRVGGGGSP